MHACIHTASQPGRQAGMQAGRHAGRQAGRQADKQTDRQTDRQTDIHVGRQKYAHTCVHAYYILLYLHIDDTWHDNWRCCLLWMAQRPRNWNRQQSRHRDLHLATRIEKAPRPTASVRIWTEFPLFWKGRYWYVRIEVTTQILTGQRLRGCSLALVLILHVGSAAIQSPWEDGREWPKMPHAPNKPGRFVMCTYWHTFLREDGHVWPPREPERIKDGWSSNMWGGPCRVQASRNTTQLLCRLRER